MTCRPFRSSSYGQHYHQVEQLQPGDWFEVWTYSGVQDLIIGVCLAIHVEDLKHRIVVLRREGSIFEVCLDPGYKIAIMSRVEGGTR